MSALKIVGPYGTRHIILMSALKIVGPYGTRHIIFNECVKNSGSLWDPAHNI